jgi:hypothetical protein
MRFGLMRGSLSVLVLGVLSLLAACGGEAKLTCDEPRRYQEAMNNERLKTPEGLDDLQTYLEMPVPEANPRPERPKGSPCLELPPQIESSE